LKFHSFSRFYSFVHLDSLLPLHSGRLLIMFKPQLLRSATRAALPAVKTPFYTVHKHQGRIISSSFSTSSALCEDKKVHTDAEINAATTSGEPGESGDHEGQFARTDRSVRVEYPEEDDLPRSVPVQGRGGLHFKKTLASFSLEGRTAVVTGGARGLGLVMAQALAQSGANVALVDLNSKCTFSQLSTFHWYGANLVRQRMKH
jgi:D-arabinitol 2-dehydrogenase